MTDLDARALVVRPRRILVDEGHSARVRLWRGGEVDSAEHSAELIDVSRGGTKLRVSTSLRFEESVRLRIQIPSIDLSCYVLASVRHIRPAGEGRWIVGCAVHPPLDEEAVARLATKAATDRRRWPRQPISLDVTVRRQLGAVQSRAAMVNLSPGGFCIRLSEPCNAGERIRIDISGGPANETVLEARTQWQMQVPGGYLTGCKFLRADDYEAMRMAARSHETTDLEVPSCASPRPRILWPTAAILVCAVSMMLAPSSGHVPSVPAASAPSFEGAARRPKVPSSAVLSEPTPSDVAKSLTNFTATSQSSDAHGMQEADGASPSPADRPNVREWTDDTGQFQVQAALVSHDVDHVILLRADGRKVRVPIAQLSAADVEYVRQQDATTSMLNAPVDVDASE